jgi:tRNA (cmo5U34)-methyltransferase
MLAVCRRRVEEQGILHRCEFHQGYIETLPPTALFDGATSLLVSQFIMDESERSRFFQAICDRLRPGGHLVNADLAADLQSPGYESLLQLWLRMMSSAEVSPEMVQRMRAAYGRDVAVLAPERVAAIIESAGFSPPVSLFQGALIHAWYCVAARQG